MMNCMSLSVTMYIYNLMSTQIVSQKLVEGYLLRAAQRSDIFAHILIWHLQVCQLEIIIWIKLHVGFFVCARLFISNE